MGLPPNSKPNTVKKIEVYRSPDRLRPRKQAETGTRIDEVCRKMGISQATFFNWKKKYSGMGTNELRRLRQLEEENKQLKQLVADLSLDKQMLQDVIKKKL